MHTAIVIPCLNEEELIAATARSLGFGAGDDLAPSDTTLLLVDNGSADGTYAILQRIQATSRPGSVCVLEEPVRGYVPPRRHGVEVAQALAAEKGVSPENLLILQADADTLYAAGYVEAMRTAARAAGPGAFVEGVLSVPPGFPEAHPGFQNLIDATDDDVAPLLAEEALDVVVSDAASGYSLAGYMAWGGHRREYDSLGEELHAETARLFIQAKRVGAARVSAPNAIAHSSRRKVLQNPIRYFASAGFPREKTWWRAWSASYGGPRDLSAFEDAKMVRALSPAIASRKAHLVVLFGALPILIERYMQPSASNRPVHPMLEEFLEQMPDVSAPFAAGQVAPLFEALFALLDVWAERFGAIRI